MSNSQRATVNERLYFCRIHLDSLRHEIAREEVGRLTLESAFAESVLLHLRRAYEAYLSEIAEAYNVSGAGFHDAAQLVASLGAASSHSAEAQECLNLESGASWLAEILDFDSAATLLRSQVQQQPVQNPSHNLLASKVSSGISLGELESYFNSLSALIESQRQRLEEW